MAEANYRRDLAALCNAGGSDGLTGIRDRPRHPKVSMKKGKVERSREEPSSYRKRGEGTGPELGNSLRQAKGPEAHSQEGRDRCVTC